MKKIALALFSAVLLSANTVSAQSYFNFPAFPASTAYAGAYATPCVQGAGVSISRDLTVGSRGNDVRMLQSFLATRHYPGGGTWMITGYFGAATRAAVINFQMDARIPQTGWVDAATRMALATTSCLGTSQTTIPTPNVWNNNVITYPNYTNTLYVPPTTTTVYPPSYNSLCNYSYYSNCPNNGTVSISYLSPSTGAVGTYVTVFGNGFTSTGNTVRFGNGIIANLNSTDGRSVSFTVPATLTGYGTQMVYLTTYNVSVSNSYGITSNSLPFTVTSLGNSGAPSIGNVTGPNTLAVNTVGTWSLSLNNPYGSNYTSVSVNWGDAIYGTSAQPAQQVYGGSQTLSFTHSYAQAGRYTITFTVTNGTGQSNIATATVTVTGSSSYGNATLSYLSPTQGRVGTQIQIIGSGFSATDNTVHFGNGGIMHVPSYNGTTIYYTVPQYLSSCDVQVSGYICAMSAQLVTPGAYQVYVTTGNSTTGSLSFQVVQ